MKEQNEKITKKDFVTYREVQLSGVTNMFDVEAVSQLSNLSRGTILNIMRNYAIYMAMWGQK